MPEVAADAGGSEPIRGTWLLPGPAQVGCEWAGEAELGVSGEDEPGPAVGGLGGADLRGRPAEGLLEQAEGVLDVEAPQVGLPEAVSVCGDGVGGGLPQLGAGEPGGGRGEAVAPPVPQVLQGDIVTVHEDPSLENIAKLGRDLLDHASQP